MPPNRRSSQWIPARGRRPKVAGSNRSASSFDVDAVDDAPATRRRVPLIKPTGGTSLRKASPPSRMESTGTEQFTSGRGRLSWRLVAILGAITVLLGAFAGVALWKPGAHISNLAYVDNSATDQVKAATKDALTALYAYDVATIDGYPDKARSVITDNMRAEFDKTVDQTVSAVKQAKTKTDVQVDPIGVSLLDSDRAELLVNLTVSATNNGVVADSAAGPIVVRMQKVGDRWLASDIVDS